MTTTRKQHANRPLTGGFGSGLGGKSLPSKMICCFVLMFWFLFTWMEALWTSDLMSRLRGRISENVLYLSMYMLVFQSAFLNYVQYQISFSVGVSKCVLKLCIMSDIFFCCLAKQMLWCVLLWTTALFSQFKTCYETSCIFPFHVTVISWYTGLFRW
jgi:hypothetical protein